MEIYGSQERLGSVNMLDRGTRGLASLCLQRVLVSTLIRQKLQENTSFWAWLLFPPSQGPRNTENLPGQSPSCCPTTWTSDSPTCVALEEDELQPNFPKLSGSRKGKPFLSGLLATKGNVLCQALVHVNPEECSGFQQPSFKGCPEVLVSIPTGLCW